jgi:hypothetical protein
VRLKGGNILQHGVGGIDEWIVGLIDTAMSMEKNQIFCEIKYMKWVNMRILSHFIFRMEIPVELRSAGQSSAGRGLSAGDFCAL